MLNRRERTEMRNKAQTFFVGIDGGATNCRARIEWPDGTLLAEGVGGCANPSHGQAIVIQSILAAIDMALDKVSEHNIGYQQLVVAAGLAGLHLPRYQSVMQTWQHPFQSLYLTDDLVVATLGAHNGGDGAVVIVGTGFSALSIVEGHQTSIGGYGFLMADQCSGSWLGYQAVQAVLYAYDKLARPTLLSELLGNRVGCDPLVIAEHFIGATASVYGELAYDVFTAAEKGDNVAKGILAKCYQFIMMVVEQLRQTRPPRISLVGGVAERISPYFPAEFTQLLSPPLNNAQQGAIAFAKAKIANRSCSRQSEKRKCRHDKQT